MVRWLPLESNPAVMNKFLGGLGVPESWTIHDVYGLDEEMLGMVPQPVGAVILLYPFSDTQEDFKKKQEEEQETEGAEVPENVYFMKQFVGNACGTVALIHAIANNRDKIQLTDGALKEFLEKTESMSPEEKGHALEADNGISKAHEESAQEGQTEAPDREAQVNEHFVAFVHVDGKLFEFDGRRKFPINHGSSSADSILGDAAKVCRQYMDRQPEESRFAVVALACSE
ncbi:ubiquitin carboxyl-terminal hydrolase isozyme L3-like isoform X1 [Eriocheir sinensis]|uniref:ubiquitin carboxyl-terminal hydrolase isozyme L3-like isoform X1 n=1 Tax=Eriocheir sinensis TaxID=95602 RepID=UPI0021C66121|nr:ubiquitin carboxyl-terminal hydrolase isozyme L3-like isoform X1 [Eriocheir sinensis]